MVLDWLTFFFDAFGSLVTWCNTFYLVGSISLLDFVIVVATATMLINVFIAKGST